MDCKFASSGSKSGRFESCWQRSVAVIDKGLIRVGYSQMASGSVRFVESSRVGGGLGD